MSKKMFEMADQLKELKTQKKKAEDQVKELNEKIAELDEELSARMIETETQSFKRAGTMFYITSKLQASAAGDRKDELFQALRDKGFESLVVENVNANSLTSFVKEQMAENGDNLPQWLLGLVKLYEKTTVGLRRG